MKVSNFSKLMLIMAMGLAGNTAYKMLKNRTDAATIAASAECLTDQTPSTLATIEEQAPIQVAIASENALDDANENDSEPIASENRVDDENQNYSDSYDDEEEDRDYETAGPDDVP